MTYQGEIGVLRWSTARELAESAQGVAIGERIQDLYLGDARAEYEAMGLLLFQIKELRSGIKAAAAAISQQLEGFLSPFVPITPFAVLQAVERDFPGLIGQLSKSGRSSIALLDGFRWALARGEQLRAAELTSYYSFEAHELGGGEMKHMVTAFLDYWPLKTLLPTWKDALHQCSDAEAEVSHFHEDLFLAQDLQNDLAHIVTALHAGVVTRLANDPLLPIGDGVGDLEQEAATAPDLESMFAIMADYFERNQVVWHTSDGEDEFAPPPMRHLLDERIRNFDLADEEATAMRPFAHTCGVVSELPACDWCPDKQGRIDGWRQEDLGDRVAGVMCIDCFLLHTDRTLGANRGGYLFLAHEVSQLVRDVCNEMCERETRDPVYLPCGSEAGEDTGVDW